MRVTICFSIMVLCYGMCLGQFVLHPCSNKVVVYKLPATDSKQILVIDTAKSIMVQKVVYSQNKYDVWFYSTSYSKPGWISAIALAYDDNYYAALDGLPTAQLPNKKKKVKNGNRLNRTL